MNIARKALPVLIIAGGVAIAALMISTRESADQVEPAPPSIAVSILEIQPMDHPARIFASGTVKAAHEVNLTPEVSGKVVWMADNLRPGARFAKGDVLARLDSRDYKADLELQKANLAAAELELSLEKSRGDAAVREWELLGSPDRDATLALRKPHLASAKAKVASAESAVERAELNMARTRLTAPFNAMVTEENISVGQLLGPTAMAAHLIGTDTFHVEVSLPISDLRHIDLPSGDTPGSAATVVQRLADGTTLESTNAHVVEVIPKLDDQTRTARLLVELNEPLDPTSGNQHIFPGAYVDVILEGAPRAGVFEVPRAALSEGNTVWVADDSDKLAKRTVDVAWGTPENVYVTSGLDAGDRVITSSVSMGIEGLDVRIVTASN